MNKDLMGSLAWGLGILLLALAASQARRMGYLEAETVTRMVLGATGLMIAWSGNRMPKVFVPELWARKARRVTAWSMVLSGLIYAGLFAFAPMQLAVAGGVAAVLIGIAVSFVYCFSLRSRAAA